MFEKPPYQAIPEGSFVFKEWLRKLWQIIFNLGNPITASLGADVALNNTATYFTGPSVAQGTSGTWFASGTVTIMDTAGAASFNIKLWDGITVMATARHNNPDSSNRAVAISGYITNPAGNIRISVKDITAATGKIIYNATTETMDSTLTAIRIA